MANTIAYEYPVVGVTPPTAAQMRTHQQMTAVVTGDGASLTFTITHNLGIPATIPNNPTVPFLGPMPEVIIENLLAAGITAAPIITSKTTNTVVFSCTAFTGAGLRVRIKRPWSPEV